MALNDIKVPKENSAGTFDEIVLTGADIGLEKPASGNASSTQVVLGNDTRLSDFRIATAHAASHASAGSDPLAPSDIGAQSIFEIATAATNTGTLTASRAKIWSLLDFTNSSYNLKLPRTGAQVGDIVVIRVPSNASWGANSQVTIGYDFEDTPGVPDFISLITISQKGVQYRYQCTTANSFGASYTLIDVDTHAHAASAITSGTLTHERGGLEADVSAYNGLVKISGGSTSAVGIGTGSTEVAAGDHSHGNLTNDGKLGTTAGLPVVTTTAGAVTTLALGTANQVLRVNSGATGVEFADPAASGVTGAAASASDVLGVSGANITGVDANADRIVFWDDSASALKYLEAGSGLSISGTALSASGGLNAMQSIAINFVLN